jgi:hypothetical protein
MTDMLRDGLSWLAGKLTSHAAREVTYQRGESQATVLATLGKTVAEQDSGEGLIMRIEIRDYLIDTASLVIDGQQVLPERGDLIIETEDGKSFTYEVLPIGSDRAWRYSDPFRLKLRIHTRLIATEEI